MNAEQFFQENTNQICVAYETPLVEARRVAAGQPLCDKAGTAPADGWQVKLGKLRLFVDADEFTKRFAPAIVTSAQDLPDGTVIKPVKKGAVIFIRPWSDYEIDSIERADSDGFSVTLPGDDKPHFVADSAFCATFNETAEPSGACLEGFFRYIPQDTDATVRTITLGKETVFDFPAGPQKAPAGAVLCDYTSLEGGYKIVSAQDFKNNFAPKPIAYFRFPGLAP